MIAERNKQKLKQDPLDVMNSVRESATVTLLRILQFHAEFTADLFDTFFCSYNESYRKARGKFLGTTPRIKFRKDWGDIYLERQKFYKLVSKLKKAGLIEKKEIEGRTKWLLSCAGKERLTPKNNRTKISNFPTIISYDIPELYHRDRDWLRRTLRELDFTLVHQSMWVGYRILTEPFLEELRERKLLDYLHILEVKEAGTVDVKH